MTTNSSAINATVINARGTLRGAAFAVERLYNCTPRPELNTSLNAHLGILEDQDHETTPYIGWFVYGNKGRRNDSEILSSAQPVSALNQNLYGLRPFRVVPLESELTTEERANYALRVVKDIDGVPHAHYYAKKMTRLASQVSYVKKDPSTGVVTAYTPTPDYLTPTPPTADANGAVTDLGDSISINLPLSIVVTGEEVYEAVGAIDGGDARYATLSEYGHIYASTKSITVEGADGEFFTYEELVNAHLVEHVTEAGFTFSTSAAQFTRQVNVSMRQLTDTSV